MKYFLSGREVIDVDITHRDGGHFIAATFADTDQDLSEAELEILTEVYKDYILEKMSELRACDLYDSFKASRFE